MCIVLGLCNRQHNNVRKWNVQRVNVHYTFRKLQVRVILCGVCAYEEMKHETLARALLVTPGEPELLAFACVLKMDVEMEDDGIVK